MSGAKTSTGAPARMWTIALALALTCAAPAADATLARVVIDSFTATGTPTDPFDFLFAPTDNRLQSWSLQAETDGGATSDNDSNTVFTWSPQTATAQTATATATVASSIQTDPLTALETPTFSLGASATPLSNGLFHNAFGSMLESGLFCFGDGDNFDGTSAGCNAAGSIVFTVFYDLIIDPVPGGLGSSAYAELDVLGTGVPNGLHADFVSTVAGDSSRLTQQFTWTADLAAGELASVSLNGTVVAQAVPEPDALALVALGLVAFAGIRLRRGGARSAQEPIS